ncbi:helix-turn-helix domain-containing protein, partial [Streptomyces virginiae]|uniref:helix-turn-helix domain-containing protein n=1 Tax=Streptomyces virginiae TaxID=1961 RepID=UPI003669DB59
MLDPTAGPLEEFAHALRALRKQAGNPSYRTMAKLAHYSVATLAEAARGLHKPSLKVTLAYVAACEGDPEAWTRRWYRLSTTLEGRDVPARGQPGGNGLVPTQPQVGRRPGAG